MSYDSACYCDELAEVDYGTTICVFCEMESEHQLNTLARNLAVACGLCRAFWDGVRREFAHHCDAPWIDSDWQPGCGREAP